MIAELQKDLNELISKLQMREANLIQRIGESDAKIKDYTERSDALKVKVESLKAREEAVALKEKSVLRGEELIKAEQKVEDERTQFRVWKEKEEKRIAADAKNAKESLDKVTLKTQDLEKRELELSREKESYKARIEKEFLAKLKG